MNTRESATNPPELSMLTRRANLDRMPREEFDIVVVAGGVVRGRGRVLTPPRAGYESRSSKRGILPAARAPGLQSLSTADCDTSLGCNWAWYVNPYSKERYFSEWPHTSRASFRLLFRSTSHRRAPRWARTN